MRAFPLKAALAALLIATPLGVASAGGGGHGHDRGDHSRSAENGKGGNGNKSDNHGNKSANNKGNKNTDHRGDKFANKDNDHHNRGHNNRGRNNRHSAEFLRDKAIVERNLALANGGSVAFNLANGSLHTADIQQAFKNGLFGPVHGFNHNGKGFHDNGKSQGRHGSNSFAMTDSNGTNGDGSSRRGGKHQGMNDNGKFDHKGKGHHAHRHNKTKKRFHEEFAFRFGPPNEADNSYYTNEMNMGPYPLYSVHPPHCVRDPNGACIVTPGGYYLSLPAAYTGAGGARTLLTGRARRVAGATTPYGAGTP
ncbi:hypothetical protein KEU06_03645 [Pseudaminobacter sp. 19-2017]|uniref:Uncharacterized protein n=1 Tax=Pseudaminobacter soli (ex Zhang et al. 2022) TaxID=2831468 RepID=A0A942I6V2_9HYPH|nr:hypothetical protein [Pseudaminobacter soli]MBS3647720.1 hypothetical protein [Pseudaminobacter soli]